MDDNGDRHPDWQLWYNGPDTDVMVPWLQLHLGPNDTYVSHVMMWWHYTDVIMSTMASQITSLTIVYSTVYSVADQRIHQSSASLAFVREIHRWLVNSPHKGPVTRKMFPFADVIMDSASVSSVIFIGTHQFNWSAIRRPPCFHVIVRRAGLLWSQQDFEWLWSVPLSSASLYWEFSFILFDLCLFMTIFNFILNYVPTVTFWIFTYHKIWILLIIFCFIWSYWITYFLTCLDVFWSVVS